MLFRLIRVFHMTAAAACNQFHTCQSYGDVSPSASDTFVTSNVGQGHADPLFIRRTRHRALYIARYGYDVMRVMRCVVFYALSFGTVHEAQRINETRYPSRHRACRMRGCTTFYKSTKNIQIRPTHQHIETASFILHSDSSIKPILHRYLSLSC